MVGRCGSEVEVWFVIYLKMVTRVRNSRLFELLPFVRD